jgi:Arc/MetJ-type ribon-helix-helix transcriptional regulator
MKRPKNASNKRMSGFNLTERHFEMIFDLMESGQYMNNSDIVRRAIELFYKENHEEMPEYKIQRLKREEEKREVDAREVKFATMPREEYCTKVLHGLSIDGKCYLPPYGGLSIPLTDVRELSINDIKTYGSQTPLLLVSELHSHTLLHDKAKKSLEEKLDGIVWDSAEYWKLVDKAKIALAEEIATLKKP